MIDKRKSSNWPASPAFPEDGSAGTRRWQILQAAAKLFSSQGFEATTVRDIASEAGILGGSIYYYFNSKDDIFLAVHAASMDMLTRAVLKAIQGVEDPWKQLEAMAVAHSRTLLSLGEISVFVAPLYSDSLKHLRAEMVRQRDRYEKLVADIVARLDLPDHIDRNVFRLHFLGALNWMPTWYRPDGGKDPAELGRQLVAMLRH